MARQREISDQVLTLLAMHPIPLGVEDIARQLIVPPWQIHRALATLHVCGGVVRILAPKRGKDGGQGRPAYLWTLPHMKPAPPELLALMRLFPIDTIVVTPSNREARIAGIGLDGRAALVYLDGDPDGPPVKLSLLKAFQPGRDRPQPVRIKD